MRNRRVAGCNDLTDRITQWGFNFKILWVNEYLSQGYLIFRGIVPPSLLTDLRREAEKARELAHKFNGPQTQRIQPLSNYGDELNLKPFYDYTELPELRDAIGKLLGDNYTHGHVDIMGLLVEPLEHPWHIGWHRDGVVEVPPEARDETVSAKLAEVWYDLRHFNQVNCAIYADSVRGSFRGATFGNGICPERNSLQAIRVCVAPRKGNLTPRWNAPA